MNIIIERLFLIIYFLICYFKQNISKNEKVVLLFNIFILDILNKIKKYELKKKKKKKKNKKKKKKKKKDN